MGHPPTPDAAVREFALDGACRALQSASALAIWGIASACPLRAPLLGN